MFVASWPAVAISGFGVARVARDVASTSQPAIFSHAKVGHKCGEGFHGLRLFLVEVLGKPLVSDAMVEGREGFGVWTIHNLVLFDEEPGLELSGRFPGLLDYVTKVIGVWGPDIGALEVVSKCVLQVFPATNRVFW